jgi:hypothetical protein
MNCQHVPALYFEEKYAVRNRMAAGQAPESGRHGEKKRNCPWRNSNPGGSVCSLVTILTEVPQLQENV